MDAQRGSKRGSKRSNLSTKAVPKGLSLMKSGDDVIGATRFAGPMGEARTKI